MTKRQPSSGLRCLFLAELLLALALTLPRSVVVPVTAATRTDQIMVSATVVAACTIALTPALLSEFARGAKPSSIPCNPVDSVPSITAPPPVSFVTRVGAAQRQVLTLEF